MSEEKNNCKSCTLKENNMFWVDLSQKSLATTGLKRICIQYSLQLIHIIILKYVIIEYTFYNLFKNILYRSRTDGDNLP